MEYVCNQWVRIFSVRMLWIYTVFWGTAGRIADTRNNNKRHKKSFHIYLIGKECYEFWFHDAIKDITSGDDAHQGIISQDGNADNVMLGHKVYNLFN